MFASHTRLCFAYLIKDVLSFWELGQLVGVVRKRMWPQAVQRKLLVACTETRTNSCSTSTCTTCTYT